MNYRGLLPKTFVTSLGDVTIGRRYYASRDCDCKEVPWDEWSGIPQGHKLTLQARRMVVLAGSKCSFDEAAEKLDELCHFQVSNDVIRRVCNEEGQEAAEWIEQASAPVQEIARTKGELEFYTDGVQVNTLEGWRELRVSVFAKREAAEPAKPAEWEERVLEKPACRVAWAAIATSDQIGASWQAMAQRLGLLNTPRLSVLGDGARWIWDEAAKNFKAIVNVDWVVDVYHVCEKIQTCAKEMFGVGCSATTKWATAQVEELIQVEGPKFIENLNRQLAVATEQKSRDALDALIGYLNHNRDSLWYRTRLAEGLPIGSGLVEGTCKNMIGKRLKLNNPRWCVPRAVNMAALRCLHYSKLWEPYWAFKGVSKKAA
jgi:hypothetical protein